MYTYKHPHIYTPYSFDSVSSGLRRNHVSVFKLLFNFIKKRFSHRLYYPVDERKRWCSCLIVMTSLSVPLHQTSLSMLFIGYIDIDNSNSVFTKVNLVHMINDFNGPLVILIHKYL